MPRVIPPVDEEIQYEDNMPPEPVGYSDVPDSAEQLALVQTFGEDSGVSWAQQEQLKPRRHERAASSASLVSAAAQDAVQKAVENKESYDEDEITREEVEGTAWVIINTPGGRQFKNRETKEIVFELEEQGHPFYYYERTQTASWISPLEKYSAIAGTEWYKITDASGHSFFYNERTGESKWQLPPRIRQQLHQMQAAEAKARAQRRLARQRREGSAGASTAHGESEEDEDEEDGVGEEGPTRRTPKKVHYAAQDDEYSDGGDESDDDDDGELEEGDYYDDDDYDSGSYDQDADYDEDMTANRMAEEEGDLDGDDDGEGFGDIAWRVAAAVGATVGAVSASVGVATSKLSDLIVTGAERGEDALGRALAMGSRKERTFGVNVSLGITPGKRVAVKLGVEDIEEWDRRRRQAEHERFMDELDELHITSVAKELEEVGQQWVGFLLDGARRVTGRRNSMTSEDLEGDFEPLEVMSPQKVKQPTASQSTIQEDDD